MAIFQFLSIALLIHPLTHALQTLPPISWTPSNNTFTPSPSTRILLSSASAPHTDTHTLTLHPPTLHSYATLFLSDLHSLFPHLNTTTLSLASVPPSAQDCDYIHLSLEPKEARTGYVYEDGTPSEEGFRLEVGECGVEVWGSGARGVWWGTRALLQGMVVGGGTVGGGSAREGPAVSVRGYMLDGGRKWYSAEFLKELCTYASWFRMSEFHFHASDNYPLNRGRNATLSLIPSHFSLLPKDPLLLPLTPHTNETHNLTSFTSLQSHCSSRGITLIPELESPGHALAITKWKPQLALSNKHDLLNLSHPETIPTVKSIWKEFLPWFDTKEVHIGADEYDPLYADEYVSFVNEMSSFIYAESGKRVRIWGTYEPTNNSVISKNVTIQHWQMGQSDPAALIAAGYKVINSDDRWAYTSLKNDHTPIYPAAYPQFFNTSRLLNVRNGTQWDADLFGVTEADRVSGSQGAIMAAWNDNGADATTQLEAYYSMREGIAVVGARAWSGRHGPRLEIDTLRDSLDILCGSAPGQNLDRRVRIPGGGGGGGWDLLEWTRPEEAGEGNITREERIGFGSKGMDYTLEITYRSVPWRLSAPGDAVSLSLSQEGILSFEADGWEYPLRSIDEHDGYDPGHPGRIWTNSTASTHKVNYIEGGNGTVVVKTDMIGGSRVWVGGIFKGRFEVFVFGGRNRLFSWSQMAFVAPLEVAEGGVERVRVWEGLVGLEV